MFTGIIEEIGTVKSVIARGGGINIAITANKIMGDLKIDDSVAIDGVCQTVVAKGNDYFEVTAVEETIRKTAFGKLRAGKKVNLERALKLSDRLGGHIVQGHVDCVGRIVSILNEGTGRNVWISFPLIFAKYLVNTGSVCINGISLTSAKVEADKFMVAVIPHTWENTTFMELKTGSEVNIEFDILGKYIEKLLQSDMYGKSNKGLSEYITQPDL